MADLREIINAALTLKKIAGMIQEYDPRPEELEDLFYLKPSLKDSYERIRNWVIPKKDQIDMSVVAPSPTDDVCVIVPSVENESGIMINENPVPITTTDIEPKVVQSESSKNKKKKSSRSIEDQTNTVLEFIKTEIDGMTRLDAISKANKALVETGLVDYNRAYNIIAKKTNRHITDAIFEIKDDTIHVFKVIEEHTEKPKEKENKPEHIPVLEVRLDERPVTVNDVLGSSFIDKQDFLKKVDGVPKSIYVNVVADILSYKGNIKFVIECEKPKTMAAYTAIAKVSAGLIAVGELKKFDDIAVCILVCGIIQKCGRKYNKVYTKLKNDYGIMLNKNFFESIIKGEFHPEILEVFCTK